MKRVHFDALDFIKEYLHYLDFNLLILNNLVAIGWNIGDLTNKLRDAIKNLNYKKIQSKTKILG